ncbi:hypothetical protein PR048_003017 [Dryococelus australis]|uniref:Uncharacterized protein n=1 Tax=Dryococelus australis TaxID=614101 RepID=A0ABQ9IME7_9NEOP|nr:hypothetical protein PR048_003017 [Dryococelus australis]
MLPTKASLVRALSWSLSDFRMWESCWTISLAGGFSRGSSVSQLLNSARSCIPELLASSLMASLSTRQERCCFSVHKQVEQMTLGEQTTLSTRSLQYCYQIVSATCPHPPQTAGLAREDLPTPTPLLLTVKRDARYFQGLFSAKRQIGKVFSVPGRRKVHTTNLAVVKVKPYQHSPVAISGLSECEFSVLPLHHGLRSKEESEQVHKCNYVKLEMERTRTGGVNLLCRANLTITAKYIVATQNRGTSRLGRGHCPYALPLSDTPLARAVNGILVFLPSTVSWYLRRDVQGVLTSGLCVLCGLVRETSSARREIQLLQPYGWYKGPSTPPALSFGNDERYPGIPADGWARARTSETGKPEKKRRFNIWPHICELEQRHRKEEVTDDSWNTTLLPPRRTGFNPRLGHRIIASENRAGRCRWSAGFLGDLSSPPPLHSGAAPYSLQ